MNFRPANLDRPSWQWSQRDWRVFRATHCGRTPKEQQRATEILTAVRSGVPVSDIAVKGKISRQYVYLILASEKLREEVSAKRFFEKRRNLGRPIDMGGPRDVWIECELFDFPA